jgi:uridine phosphorylase
MADVQYHVHVGAGDVGRYVLLPGDPGRCEPIAALFESPKHIAHHREYNTFTGLIDGEKVSVTSTGIGGPSSAIAMEELARVGADTFVRVGQSGAMQEWISPGDLGVITAAIRDEGTSRNYLPIEFPAVADRDVTSALLEGAKRVGATVHLGIAASKDSFYTQQGQTPRSGSVPVANYLRDRWLAWMAGGAIASEMEAATQFIVASVLGKRAGAILLIGGHADMRPMTSEEEARCSLDLLLRASIEGVRELIARDRAARA